MRIVLLGAPGVGKGTQAARLSARLGVPVHSTGDMMRREAESGSDTGRSIQTALANGNLIADDLVLGAVYRSLSGGDLQCGFILDGFPRTVDQARALDGWLTSRSAPLDAALDFELGDDELLRRVLRRGDEARAAGKTGRVDDKPEAFRIRLSEFRLHAAPLREHYASTGRLHGFDASEEPDRVTGSILLALGSDRSSR